MHIVFAIFFIYFCSYKLFQTFVFSSDCEDSPELPPPPGLSDNRLCVLCMKYGDENTNVRNLLDITLTHIWLSLCPLKHCYMFQEGGRLLYIGQNEWTHVNCALWSAEVFEDDDGSLKNVHMAVLRGKQLVRQDTLSLQSSQLVLNVFLVDKHVQSVVLLYFLLALREVSKARGHSRLLPHLLHQ